MGKPFEALSRMKGLRAAERVCEVEKANSHRNKFSNGLLLLGLGFRGLGV